MSAVKNEKITKGESQKIDSSLSKSKAAVFTYIGGGEDSPRIIEFMGGRQRFVRGQATEVTDPIVLAKVVNNPCFISGEIAVDQLHQYDEHAKAQADDQRKKDIIKNESWMRKHRLAE